MAISDDFGPTSTTAMGAIITFPPELGATQGLSNYMGFEPFRIVGGFGSQRDRLHWTVDH